jgi:hypothetical protein
LGCLLDIISSPRLSRISLVFASLQAIKDRKITAIGINFKKAFILLIFDRDSILTYIKGAGIISLFLGHEGRFYIPFEDFISKNKSTACKML